MLSNTLLQKLCHSYSILHSLTRSLAGFSPTGEVFIHQCVETGIMTGFQQMAQLMNDHMLDTPLWQ
jgi:hypothetical protein